MRVKGYGVKFRVRVRIRVRVRVRFSDLQQEARAGGGHNLQPFRGFVSY